MNAIPFYGLLAVQIIATAYGLMNEFQYPDALVQLPRGMGISIAIISTTMSAVLMHVEKEIRTREKAQARETVMENVSHRLSACVTMHEQEFYALWPEQVRRARNNVDITHLGNRPPRTRNGIAESAYFGELKKVYRATNATIRRVERYSPEKEMWIDELIRNLSNLPNFSLAVYVDPLSDEMPAALSVCRIDNKYAWIIAAAEHESTGSVRDILLTGPDSTDLIRCYFQQRLWARSTIVVDHGVIVDRDWKSRVKIA